MKVAIACDWLLGGGAERVVAAIHDMYPEAPIYTSYVSPSQRKALAGADIRTPKFLGSWVGGKLRKLSPLLRERYFTSLDFSGYDLVISASGAEAKGLNVPEGALHIDYCHSPTHYYWVRTGEYMANPGLGFLDPVARLGLRMLLSGRRKWDQAAAQRPDVMIANSTITKQRIYEFYGREVDVIFPPVDIENFQVNQTTRRQGFVVVGRQTPYKRIDLAVAACSKLQLPLKVIGSGPDHAKLRAMAGDTVTFLTDVSDADMARHLQTAEALIFPGLEDFGITSVEAMACGTPVIAFKAGGALDTVIAGQTGQFFERQTVPSLSRALTKFDSAAFSPAQIRAHAEQFSVKRFERELKQLVDRAMKDRA